MKTASTARLILYMLALFLAGGATGGMIATKLTKDRMYRAPTSSELKSRMRDKLMSRLQLTPEQLGTIDPLITETAAQLQGTCRDSFRRTGQIMKDFNARLASKLTPEQRTLLEVMELERQDFIRKKCRPKSSNGRDWDDRTNEKPSTANQERNVQK
jgi:hypothetical protein